MSASRFIPGLCVTAALLWCVDPAIAQQKANKPDPQEKSPPAVQEQVARPAQQTARPRASAATQPVGSSIVLAAHYFNPAYKQIDDYFAALEKSLRLPPGKKLQSLGFVTAGLRLGVTDYSGLLAEVGGMAFKEKADSTSNYLRHFYAGAGWWFRYPIGPIEITAQGAAGYGGLRAQRSYTNNPGMATIDANLLNLRALAGVALVLPMGVTVGVEGGYHYATTLSPKRADLDITVDGLAAGLVVTFPLETSVAP